MTILTDMDKSNDSWTNVSDDGESVGRGQSPARSELCESRPHSGSSLITGPSTFALCDDLPIVYQPHSYLLYAPGQLASTDKALTFNQLYELFEQASDSTVTSGSQLKKTGHGTRPRAATSPVGIDQDSESDKPRSQSLTVPGKTKKKSISAPRLNIITQNLSKIMTRNKTGTPVSHSRKVRRRNTSTSYESHKVDPERRESNTSSSDFSDAQGARFLSSDSNRISDTISVSSFPRSTDSICTDDGLYESSSDSPSSRTSTDDPLLCQNPQADDYDDGSILAYLMNRFSLDSDSSLMSRDLSDEFSLDTCGTFEEDIRSNAQDRRFSKQYESVTSIIAEERDATHDVDLRVLQSDNFEAYLDETSDRRILYASTEHVIYRRRYLNPVRVKKDAVKSYELQKPFLRRDRSNTDPLRGIDEAYLFNDGISNGIMNNNDIDFSSYEDDLESAAKLSTHGDRSKCMATRPNTGTLTTRLTHRRHSDTSSDCMCQSISNETSLKSKVIKPSTEASSGKIRRFSENVHNNTASKELRQVTLSKRKISAETRRCIKVETFV